MPLSRLTTAKRGNESASAPRSLGQDTSVREVQVGTVRVALMLAHRIVIASKLPSVHSVCVLHVSAVACFEGMRRCRVRGLEWSAR